MKHYTLEEKAHALAALKASNGNISRAAKIVNVPRKTLSQWANGTSGVRDLPPLLVTEAERDLGDKLDIVAHKLVDAMPEKIAKATLSQVSVALGIAIDKTNLLRGKPTSITERRSDKDRYESAIAQMIQECSTKGVTINREEAIRILAAQIPEISKVVNAI